MSNPRVSNMFWLSLGCAVASLGWAYLPTLQFLVEKWIDDPQYSHGFLVPCVSAYLGYRRYQRGELKIGQPRIFVGLGLLGSLLPLRWLAGGLMFHQLDALTLIVSLAALTLLSGGWPFLRSLWPALAFLVFMIPLPYEFERNVGGPLKLIAVQASTYLLQTLGQPALAEGNLILIDEVRLGVVDACSGLKMLMTFSAFAVGAVFLSERTAFEKFLVLLGIVPIAVFVNVLRIVATGIAYTLTDDKATLNFMHDLHGYLMMPAGLGLLGAQLWALSRLVVPAEGCPAAGGPDTPAAASLFR